MFSKWAFKSCKKHELHWRAGALAWVEWITSARARLLAPRILFPNQTLSCQKCLHTSSLSYCVIKNLLPFFTLSEGTRRRCVTLTFTKYSLNVLVFERKKLSYDWAKKGVGGKSKKATADKIVFIWFSEESDISSRTAVASSIARTFRVNASINFLP